MSLDSSFGEAKQPERPGLPRAQRPLPWLRVWLPLSWSHLPKMPPTPTLEHWYAALNSPLGVCLRTSDRERLRAALYKSRAEACDETLQALSVVFSPTASDEVWIVKKGPSDGVPA